MLSFEKSTQVACLVFPIPTQIAHLILEIVAVPDHLYTFKVFDHHVLFVEVCQSLSFLEIGFDLKGIGENLEIGGAISFLLHHQFPYFFIASQHHNSVFVFVSGAGAHSKMQERNPFKILPFLSLHSQHHCNDIHAIQNTDVVFTVDVGRKFLLAVEEEFLVLVQVYREIVLDSY